MIAILARDRNFESTSLQRRICKPSVPRAIPATSNRSIVRVSKPAPGVLTPGRYHASVTAGRGF